MARAESKHNRPTQSPKQACLSVVRRLHRAGYQALLAGGCVRDMLMKKTPHDYDVATNAVPKAVQKVFPRTLMVGARFGVVIVLTGGRQIEVATFRSDQCYHDGRRPEKVVFTDAQHDAERRDFTINGMFYDPIEKKVIDYVGGRDDLKAHVVRAIGNPVSRFEEDHLRMLRAIRFAGRLDFEIEPKTAAAIRRHADKITRISSERIAAEIEMILTDPNRARSVQLAIDSGLLSRIFDTLSEEQLRFGQQVVSHLPQRSSFALALAALCCGADENKINRVCRRLKTSNDLRKHTHWLIANQHSLIDAIPMTKGHLKKWLAEPLFESLVTLIRCRLQAAGDRDSPLRQLRKHIKGLGDEPIAPPRLLDGHELIALGATPGPMVGHLAEELYLAQLENQVKTKSQARQWTQQWLADHHDITTQ